MITTLLALHMATVIKDSLSCTQWFISTASNLANFHLLILRKNGPCLKFAVYVTQNLNFNTSKPEMKVFHASGMTET